MTTPVYARGVAKIVSIGAETTYGVASTAAGQQLRRTSADLNLNVAEIQSAEILPSQQVRDNRHGPRSVQGTIAGQLSPATYRMLFEGMLRNTFAPYGFANSTIGPLSDTTAAVQPSGNLALTSPSTNFGNLLKLGDVVRLAAVTGGAVSDNAQNLRVISTSGNNVVLGPPSAVVGWSAGAESALQIVAPGKRLITPATGQLDLSYTIEQFYSDMAVSELFTGCKVTQLSLNIPPSGFVTMQASITGQQLTTGFSQRFPGAAAPSTTTGLTAVSGEVCYNGQALGYVTGLSLQIASQVDAPPVVGSNIVPNIFNGTLSVRGSLTALFTGDSLDADFINEYEVSISMLLTASPVAGADFISIHLPRVKLTSATKNDSDRGITRSYNFVALENVTNLAADLSSILVQDSDVT